jgi:hypothetical protein
MARGMVEKYNQLRDTKYNIVDCLVQAWKTVAASSTIRIIQ